MREGALVLADCLGFRGIWNRIDPEKLIESLQSMEEAAVKRVVLKYTASMLSFGPARYHLRLLSDTVALSIQYDSQAYASGAQPDERQKNLLVSVACESAAVLAHLFIDNDVSLPLRGCISFGPHLCEGNFLVGPAVDQAAEYMNTAEGAFIWALPAVAERHRKFLAHSLALLSLPREMLLQAAEIVGQRGATEVAQILEHPDAGSDAFIEAVRMTFAQVLTVPTLVEPYPVPMKGGSTLDSAVINPFISARSEEDRRRVMQRYEQFLQGDRLDIWIKRQNTLKFLKVAERLAAEFRASLVPDKPPLEGDPASS